MSISEEILRIQTARNTIRTKLVAMGLTASTADIDDCATAVNGITNRGAVSVEILEGTSYTIPAGYHNGSGTVKAMTDTTGEAEKYKTQTKSATPTKSQQNIVPDTGYYALSAVTVGAIPENYQDVTPVTAGAGDVLANKVIVDKTGKSVAGTMPNNGAVSKTIDAVTTSYTIPAGYHSGAGTVSVVPQTPTVTPTKSQQTLTPSSGKVFTKVTINAIPADYQDVSAVNATADTVLTGSKFVDSSGNAIDGTMPNNGAVSKVISVATPSYTIPAGYHNGSGTVSVSTETKSAVPSTSTQEITPTAGKVLSKVTINPIPGRYQDVTGVTAKAGDVLEDKYIVTSDGKTVEGTIPNRGTLDKTIDGLSTMTATIPAGFYPSVGTVTITNDIENALAAI